MALFKLLLVEDEAATRNGLLQHIDWQALGIREVATAKDGTEGLVQAEAFRPDILISDIRMPGMDGIALADAVLAFLPRCRIIFLSGYSDKAYLKAAIRFGAVSYVEKPIELDELTEAIGRAVQQCMEAANGATPPPLSDGSLIHSALHGAPEALAALAKRLQLGEERSGCVVLLVRSHREQEQAERVLAAMHQALRLRARVCGTVGSQYAAVVSGLSPQALQQEATAFLGTLTRLCDGEHQFFCGVGTCVPTLADLNASYDAAACALKQLFFQGYGAVAFYRPADAPAANLQGIDEAAFLRLVQDGDTQTVSAFLNRLCAQAQACAREGQIKDALLKYAFALTREAERRGIRAASGESESDHFFWNAISTAPTLEALRELFLTHVAQSIEAFQRQDANNRSITQVLRDIEQHYAHQDLSIKQLAERAYLTPTYLSFLFKKTTGQTASEWITSFRIEKAKELLLSNVKLVEVAQRVGYGDANYFSKTFKRQTGMTPSKFRESHKT